MTELDRLRERHAEAVRALAVAEARFRRAEEEDEESRLDARHGGPADPGCQHTDRAADALSHASAVEQAAALALEAAINANRPQEVTDDRPHRPQPSIR
jgi:hypothetical protein